MEPEDIEIPPEQIEKAFAFISLLMLSGFAVMLASTWGVQAGLALLGLVFVILAGILLTKLVKAWRTDSGSKEDLIRARVAEIDDEIAPRRQERRELQAELETLEQKKGYRGSR